MNLLKLKEIPKIISDEYQGKRVVFMSGAFDLFHYGHFHALYTASQLGDIFVLQIDGNRLVKNRKGKERPFMDEKERAQIITSLKFVNFAFISNTPSEDIRTLQMINPDVFVRAKLHTETNLDRKIREKTILTKMTRGRIVWLEQTPEISTTKIVSALIKPNDFHFNPRKNLSMKSTSLAN
ncbi:hypothetical protein A3I53_04525 [Candidatus Curtissbacteria bacterium RIFCSPLOWO2_02_FULL_40_13b]|uniref:Cytidyltransferase-like domain-containing protein n=1 Tax=Candidatus Curtissbacteria bacterium RIFCSPLOWO2_02_FULL_40_13b TaxID=1797733 RepID=A0A1F5HV34_9BACT|nr:MAG: hypothetical protein A3I53_04525 [Candidatus Curtissbacteria bacterium RIFCSPLOWO2_02_FULL_40_13b]